MESFWITHAIDQKKLFPVLVNASSTSLIGDRFVPGFMYFYTIYDESLLVLEREFSREAWRLKYCHLKNCHIIKSTVKHKTSENFNEHFSSF